MDIEKVLELRRDWQITLKVVNNVSHPASFAAISEALNLQSEIEAYREARNDYMAHREERRRRIRTAAALAAAEAEVARLRAALDKFTTSILTTPSYLPEALWCAHIAAENARASVGLPAIVDEESNHENG